MKNLRAWKKARIKEIRKMSLEDVVNRLEEFGECCPYCIYENLQRNESVNFCEADCIQGITLYMKGK